MWVIYCRVVDILVDIMLCGLYNWPLGNMVIQWFLCSSVNYRILHNCFQRSTIKASHRALCSPSQPGNLRKPSCFESTCFFFLWSQTFNSKYVIKVFQASPSNQRCLCRCLLGAPPPSCREDCKGKNLKIVFYLCHLLLRRCLGAYQAGSLSWWSTSPPSP